MRWIHLAGGLMLTLLAFAPKAFRPLRFLIWIPLGISFGSGVYNFMTKIVDVPKGYHMWFGIKMLLVMHIFAIYFLVGIGRGDEKKHKRWAIGVAISSVLAICLGEYLRYLRMHP